MKQLVIIGAGGHGRVCAEIAEMSGYKKVLFLDDAPSDNSTIVGASSDFSLFLNGYDIFVAIGNNALRKGILQTIGKQGGTIATLIHPDSTVSSNAFVDVGSVVMAGAVVNPGAFVGKGAIINTCSSVDHDCKIGNYAHISVGAHLAGTVTVGDETFIGAGATIINNIVICENCIVGAGSTVINDIMESGTYVGAPTRRIK